jgi:peptidoglycan LD-endopeptidase CwlK
MPISNRIEDLHPDLAKVYTEAKARYIADNPGRLKPRLGETARPAAVQRAYYAQGRQPLATINQLRHQAGLAPIGPVEAKQVITKAQPGQSAHGFQPSRAFDVQLVKPDGSIDWNEAEYAKFAGYVKLAATMLGVAISQGAYWPKFKDYPHTELLNWRTMR